MSVLPVHIEDVTAVTDLDADIPLEKLVSENEEAGFDAEHAEGVVFKLREPKATALVFPSGKIVCTGSKSIQQAKIAIDQVVERIGQLGVAVPDDPEITIEKIVAAFRMTAPFELEKVAELLEGAEYDPEKIEGVVYRTTEPKSEFLILKNGKIICTGSNSIKEIQSSVKSLKEKLNKAGIKTDFVEE